MKEVRRINIDKVVIDGEIYKVAECGCVDGHFFLINRMDAYSHQLYIVDVEPKVMDEESINIFMEEHINHGTSNVGSLKKMRKELNDFIEMVLKS